MKVLNAFSRFAHEYNKYNIIQKEVVKTLCGLLDKKSYPKILDVGAGDGAIYQKLSKDNINFQHFVSLDFSQEMLDIHPSTTFVKKVCVDFNHPSFSSIFKEDKFDLVISSSALQWSTDLPSLLNTLSQLGENHLFSFFTANTFKTLHSIVGVKSPILDKAEIIEALSMVFNYEVKTIEYRLEFNSVYEMLRYIKKSGVNGGVEQLSYKEIKFLIVEYPLGYLEFEVLFVQVLGKK